jgi:hypothetical protein
VDHEMPDRFPEFESDDEMREWFDNANLSDYSLEQALGVVIAARVHLTVGDDASTPGSGSAGATGTLSSKPNFELVRG